MLTIPRSVALLQSSHCVTSGEGIQTHEIMQTIVEEAPWPLAPRAQYFHLGSVRPLAVACCWWDINFDDQSLRIGVSRNQHHHKGTLIPTCGLNEVSNETPIGAQGTFKVLCIAVHCYLAFLSKNATRHLGVGGHWTLDLRREGGGSR